MEHLLYKSSEHVTESKISLDIRDCRQLNESGVWTAADLYTHRHTHTHAHTHTLYIIIANNPKMQAFNDANSK